MGNAASSVDNASISVFYASRFLGNAFSATSKGDAFAVAGIAFQQDVACGLDSGRRSARFRRLIVTQREGRRL